ncbi:pyridoxamine 5'-phosphate oxidase family protein [Streptomyces sp. NRRL S-813]|uniref:pyridoxamine 5'-phosphate oxidase family protein n=1 Tax=Streptomyces sp. NRRL S-813 TaxID=1463919 RepID=UPI0004C0C980|nr:pyridoxamine 5'-phosphate oxidase family protein [Streptomyces sp. NRRL S-813]
MSAAGFHEGERIIQRLAGVAEKADRLQGMLQPPRLTGGLSTALAGRSFAVLTARDHDGALWISPISAEPGFLVAGGTALAVHARPATYDPLHNVPVPQHVGLLAIDFGIRRRIRVNGKLTGQSANLLTIHADQAFGNCPSYIQQRHLMKTRMPEPTANPGQWKAHSNTDTGALEDEHIDLIGNADTFFLGTIHPTRGADASHKGGQPGFVRIVDGEIWWPDYAGNNLFNSLGNITVDPATALLFIDFTTGRTLQVSGEAKIEWLDPSACQDEGGTGRRVRFTPHRIRGGYMPVLGDLLSFSPHNPAVTRSPGA